MALDEGQIDLQNAFRDRAEGLIPPEILQQLVPAQTITYPLDASYCLDGLQYEDGAAAPDAQFYFSVNLEFANQQAYDTFAEHPDLDEIIGTLYNRASGGIEESLGLELERDFYNPEARFNQFAPNTPEDLEISIAEFLPEINATYDIDIRGVDVPPRSTQYEGCDAAPIEIDENGHTIATLGTKGASLIPGG